MKDIIRSSLNRSMSYQAYRALVGQMAKENKSSGSDITEASIKFTKLNDRRMKRWDKTLRINNKHQAKIKSFDQSVIWLVISESWCGDSAHILPVLNKIAEVNENIDLKIAFRDENPQLINMFLTYGDRAIPKLIMLDKVSQQVLATYGPWPSEATSYVYRFKAMYGKLTPDFKIDLQHWYNHNRGQNIVEDVIEILNTLLPTASQ